MRNNLSGQKFGRIEVLEPSHLSEHKEWYYRCKCECGKEKIIRGSSMVSGLTTSCGCAHRKSGDDISSKTRGYRTWYGLINSGKDVTARWWGEEGFKNFIQDVGSKPEGKNRLVRKDETVMFKKDNCSWK